jgi:hypothetical protein
MAMTKASFPNHREAALALLNNGFGLSHKAGQFLGQLVVNPAPMTEKQEDWLSKLLEKNQLPPLDAHEAW